jgi:hypothetical protein
MMIGRPPGPALGWRAAIRCSRPSRATTAVCASGWGRVEQRGGGAAGSADGPAGVRAATGESPPCGGSPPRSTRNLIPNGTECNSGAPVTRCGHALRRSRRTRRHACPTISGPRDGHAPARRSQALARRGARLDRWLGRSVRGAGLLQLTVRADGPRAPAADGGGVGGGRAGDGCTALPVGETFDRFRANTNAAHVRRSTPVGVFPDGDTPEASRTWPATPSSGRPASPAMPPATSRRWTIPIPPTRPTDGRTRRRRPASAGSRGVGRCHTPPRRPMP